jgi:4-diphosphocytidyl-2-C-methyl-D-erythritol kinase
MEWYPAPGKLNLFLHVLARRDDGYHLLQTVFRLIDRCDRVGIASRTDGQLRRIDALPGVAPDADLCLRAARLLKERALARLGAGAEDLGADIGLDKVLPIGGGLGGGSSDAATVLIVLNKLWGLDLTRAELLALAGRLGADVPLFVFGENAIGEGIGDALTALSLGPAWYLVLDPQVHVSTREIFAAPALTRNSKRLKIPPFFPGLGRNDLEPVVAARFPNVAANLSWLRRHRTDARMSGSGACVFAEFATQEQAVEVQAQVPMTMRSFVTRGLERHPLRDWSE